MPVVCSPVPLLCGSNLLFAFVLHRLRYATPMEEGKMSWRVRPYGLDQGLASNLLPHNHARLVQPYLDVDGDEAQARQLVLDRWEKRKAMLAKAAAK